MAELFIELFSEEIPAKLQIDAREKIKQKMEESLKKNEIQFSSSKSYSTPKRLIFFMEGIPEKITISTNDADDKNIEKNDNNSEQDNPESAPTDTKSE